MTASSDFEQLPNLRKAFESVVGDPIPQAFPHERVERKKRSLFEKFTIAATFIGVTYGAGEAALNLYEHPVVAGAIVGAVLVPEFLAVDAAAVYWGFDMLLGTGTGALAGIAHSSSGSDSSEKSEFVKVAKDNKNSAVILNSKPVSFDYIPSAQKTDLSCVPANVDGAPVPGYFTPDYNPEKFIFSAALK